MTTLERIIINAKLEESKIATICKKNLIDALKRLKKASRNNTIYKDTYFGQVTALTRIFYKTDTETAHY